MSTPLLLVGAGGFAREAAAAVAAINAAADSEVWRPLGFLDDDPAVHGRMLGGLPVLGPIDLVAEHPAASVVVCTGNPSNWWSRRMIVERLALPAERYATIVHPAAVLGAPTTVGAGTVVLAGTITTTDVRIGAHVAVMPGVILTHDDVVGDYSTFGSGVRLGGGVQVGEGAYVGAAALVKEGCSIGAWSQVGMGAVVLGDVPSREVWVGAPARCLRASGAPAPALAELRTQSGVITPDLEQQTLKLAR